MYSGSMLDAPLSPQVMSTSDLFLVKGDATLGDDIIFDKPKPTSGCCSCPVLNHLEDQHYSERSSGPSNSGAVQEIQEKDLSKDFCQPRFSKIGDEHIQDIPCKFPGDGAVPDDGYRTPVSEDCKIKPVLECPPAPKKCKTTLPWRKRGLPQACDGRKEHRVGLVIHLASEDVKAMFPPIILSKALNIKIKKARRDEPAE